MVLAPFLSKTSCPVELPSRMDACSPETGSLRYGPIDSCDCLEEQVWVTLYLDYGRREALKGNYFLIMTGFLDNCVCLGQWCGYHRCGPRRAGVYAAQHAAGRECVSCSAAAG